MAGTSLDNTNYESAKLLKLKVTEQNLAAMLQKIDKEINQTEVEWMHLKSLVKTPKTAQPTNDLKYFDQRKPCVQKLVKSEHHIDDQAVNNIKIDLSLGNSDPHIASSDQEDSN